MARFDTSGLDEVIAEMEAQGQLIGPAADAMLMAGAEAVKQAWQQAAEQHGHRDTGAMIDSIGYASAPKTIGDAKTIDIFPQGGLCEVVLQNPHLCLQREIQADSLDDFPVPVFHLPEVLDKTSALRGFFITHHQQIRDLDILRKTFPGCGSYQNSPVRISLYNFPHSPKLSRVCQRGSAEFRNNCSHR